MAGQRGGGRTEGAPHRHVGRRHAQRPGRDDRRVLSGAGRRKGRQRRSKPLWRGRSRRRALPRGSGWAGAAAHQPFRRVPGARRRAAGATGSRPVQVGAAQAAAGRRQRRLRGRGGWQPESRDHQRGRWQRRIGREAGRRAWEDRFALQKQRPRGEGEEEGAPHEGAPHGGDWRATGTRPVAVSAQWGPSAAADRASGRRAGTAGCRTGAEQHLSICVAW